MLHTHPHTPDRQTHGTSVAVVSRSHAWTCDVFFSTRPERDAVWPPLSSSFTLTSVVGWEVTNHSGQAGNGPSGHYHHQLTRVYTHMLHTCPPLTSAHLPSHPSYHHLTKPSVSHLSDMTRHNRDLAGTHPQTSHHPPLDDKTKQNTRP